MPQQSSQQLSLQMPVPVPRRLGLPCWRKENVADVIKVVARTSLDETSTRYFLATHAPIERIWDDLGGTLISESELFDRLLDPVHANVLALVQGEPGSGKSHLIRWLHLRLGLRRDRDEARDIVPVLVQRRTGSLKDALEQIIQQLPPEFERHLAQLREAIGNISDATAREMLASQLQLELGPRWVDRGHTPLPSSLRQINALCISAGFRKWLCRDGGVIDANIKRLTQPSDALERQSLPEFTAAELDIPAGYKPDNVDAVRRLIDEFDEFDEAREHTANFFNHALRHAIKEMSGLGGTRLRDVFDAVRTDLHREGKSLALFIEDISVMSSLDEDIFNAVEPQDRDDLCRLIAVLGMVTQGRHREHRLRENQLSRVTHKVSVGGDITSVWRNDAPSVARFTARYLNASRLAEASVARLAQQREAGADVGLSACTDCPVREPCHARFGAVSFEGVDVGLFPLNVAAPQIFLSHLNEHVEGVRSNQRGMLERILRPILADAETLEEGTFPRVRLPVVLHQPPYWTEFEAEYCGGWSFEDRERAKLLCQAWVVAATANAAASALAPLREPLGLPPFSRAPQATPDPTPETTNASPPLPVQQPPSGELQKLLDSLSVWEADGRLTHDTEPRELLQQFIRDSISWYDHRLPAGLGPKLFADRSAVTLHGQRSKVQEGRFTVVFPLAGAHGTDREQREEVRRVIEALARFKYEGQRSWAFPRGELHKRVASSWLRLHEEQIVSACELPAEIDSSKPIAFALRFLAVVALMRRRAAFPTTPAVVLAEMLKPPETALAGLTLEEEALAAEVTTKFPIVRDFLLNELNVSQGPGGGINFIDPSRVLDLLLPAGLEALDLNPLPGVYFSGYWKSRYQPLNDLPRSHRLGATIERKRIAIQTELAGVQTAMMDAGTEGETLPNRVKEYCSQFVQLLAVQDDVVPLPDVEFDRVRPLLATRAAAWATAIGGAMESAASSTTAILALDPTPFKEAVDAIASAQRYFARLEREVAKQEAAVTTNGDPDLLREELLEALEAIAVAPQRSKEGDTTATPDNSAS
jgi:hypothetical protein